MDTVEEKRNEILKSRGELTGLVTMEFFASDIQATSEVTLVRLMVIANSIHKKAAKSKHMTAEGFKKLILKELKGQTGLSPDESGKTVAFDVGAGKLIDMTIGWAVSMGNKPLPHWCGLPLWKIVGPLTLYNAAHPEVNDRVDDRKFMMDIVKDITNKLTNGMNPNLN
jgi:hypothetical protein